MRPNVRSSNYSTCIPYQLLWDEHRSEMSVCTRPMLAKTKKIIKMQKSEIKNKWSGDVVDSYLSAEFGINLV